MKDMTKDTLERTETAWREGFYDLEISQKNFTLKQRLIWLKRARLKRRIIITDFNNKVLFDRTYKRDKLNINDVPADLLERYPKRTTIYDLKGVIKTIHFEIWL
jgi:hypothetical protein